MRYISLITTSVAALCGMALSTGTAFAQGANELPARIVLKLRSQAAPGENAQEQLARMRERPSDELIDALNLRAGTTLTWTRALADGAHVFMLDALGSELSASVVSERVQGAPEVAWAEADHTVTTQSVSDPYFSHLWSFTAPISSSYGVDFESAWLTQQGVPSVRIAVLDTGILPHPDIVGPEGIASNSGALAGEGYDFISDCRMRATCPASTPNSAAIVEPQPHALDQGDWISEADRETAFFSKCKLKSSSWHGSHTAGTVSALADNGQGVVGGSFGATIMPVRVLGKCGGYTSDIAEAIRWAAGVHPIISNPAPARVLNLSLGALGSCGTTLQSAIDAASAAGASVVVAAGNDAKDASKSMLPNCANVIAVAATTKEGDLAYYSNYSATHVAISAPGGDTRTLATSGILSLYNMGTTVHDPAGWTYAYGQGTSTATPHVAAAVALMLSRNPDLTPAQLTSILKAPSSVTAFPSGSRCATAGDCGAGLLNAQRAVSSALSPLRASAPSVDFGAMASGSVVYRELSITNDSTAAVTAGSAALLGSSGFSFDADECSGQTLAATESCRMVLAFEASIDGLVSGGLHMPTASGIEGAVLAVHLTGLVGSRLQSPTPEISLGEWLVGETQSVTISIESRYGEPELLGTAYLVGNDAVISHDGCSNLELAAQAQCELEVTITPSDVGEVMLQLVTNTAGTNDVPYAVTITGTVVTTVSPPASDDDATNSDADDGDASGGDASDEDASGEETSDDPSSSVPPPSQETSSGGGGGTMAAGWLLLLAMLRLRRSLEICLRMVQLAISRILRSELGISTRMEPCRK